MVVCSGLVTDDGKCSPLGRVRNVEWRAIYAMNQLHELCKISSYDDKREADE